MVFSLWWCCLRIKWKLHLQNNQTSIINCSRCCFFVAADTKTGATLQSTHRRNMKNIFQPVPQIHFLLLMFDTISAASPVFYSLTFGPLSDWHKCILLPWNFSVGEDNLQRYTAAEWRIFPLFLFFFFSFWCLVLMATAWAAFLGAVLSMQLSW